MNGEHRIADIQDSRFGLPLANLKNRQLQLEVEKKQQLLRKAEASFSVVAERIQTAKSSLATARNLHRHLKEARKELESKYQNNNEWLEKDQTELRRLESLLIDRENEKKTGDKSLALLQNPKLPISSSQKQSERWFLYCPAAERINAAKYASPRAGEELIGKNHHTGRLSFLKILRTLQRSVSMSFQEKQKFLRAQVSKKKEELTLIHEVSVRLQDEDVQQENLYQDLLKRLRQESKKLQNLEASREALSREKDEKLSTLSMLEKKLESAQQELLQSQFGLAEHWSERSQLLQQWEASLLQIEFRDGDIKELENLLVEKKAEVQVKEGEVQSLEKKIAEQEKVLQSSRRKKESVVSAVNTLKMNLDSENNRLQAVIAEGKLLSNRLAFYEQETEELRQQTKDHAKDNMKLVEAVEKASDRESAQLETLVRLQENSRSSDEKLMEMSNLVMEEQRHVDELQGSVEQLNQGRSKLEAKLRVSQSSVRNAVIQIETSKKAKLSCQKEQQDTEARAQITEEIQYKTAYEILTTKQKISSLQESDADSSEQSQLWKDNAAKLTKEVNEKSRVFVILKQEVLTSQSSVQRLLRMVEFEDSRRESVFSQLKALKAVDTSLQSRQREILSEIDQKQLQLGLLRLHVECKQKLLGMKSRKVLNFQERKRNLELIIQKRSVDLLNEEKQLICEMKIAREEASKFRSLWNSKIAQLHKVVGRYELVMKSVLTGKYIDENGTPEIPSEAYCILKLAQEKEEARECLNQLQAEVQSLRQDFSALRNTSSLVQASNSNFRLTAVRGIVSGSAKDERELRVLEKEQMEKLLTTRQAGMKTLEGNILKLESELEQMDKEANDIVKELDAFRQKQKHGKYELLNYKEKITRTKVLIDKTKEEIRRKNRTNMKTTEEMMIEYTELKMKQSEAQELLTRLAKIGSPASRAHSTGTESVLAGKTVSAGDGLILNLETGRVSLSVNLEQGEAPSVGEAETS